MQQNQHRAGSIASVECAIITVSDTRTAETDTSGASIRQRLESAGHRVRWQAIVPDEPERVVEQVTKLCHDDTCHAVLLTGGTGLSPRDNTYEAVVEILEKRLDGFGELFRMLSYQQIGSAAMLSRAVAGVSSGTIVFAMPGSTGAVALAMDQLILPELGHIAALISMP